MELLGAKPQRAQRFKVRWKLKIAGVNKRSKMSLAFDEGRVMDMSATGLGAVTLKPISAGDLCMCLLYPPTPDVPLITFGRAIWQKPIKRAFATGIECLGWQREPELDLALRLAKAH